MKFKAELLLHGKTATGLEVPDSVVEKLGGGKRPPVVVTLKGYSYRTTVAPMGGKYLIGVNAEHRVAAGVKAGDVLVVDVTLDTAPREVAVPSYVEDALNNAGVRAAFDKLSYTNRKELVRSLGKMAEEARVRVRANRRTAIDGAKKLKASGGLTEDQLRDVEDEVQKLTDRFVKSIDDHLKHKEAEVMKV